MVRKIKPTKEERQATQPKVDEPDEFLSLSQQAFDWMAGHSKLVMTIIGVFLGVGIVYSAINIYLGSVDDKASAQLAEVVRLQRGQVDLTGEVKPTGSEVVFKSDQEKAQAVRDAAEKLIQAHGSHQASLAARLYLGRACLDLDDADCALQAYDGAVKLTGADDMLRNAALLGLAAAQEQKGDLGAAAGTYGQVADGKGSFAKDIGLYHAARTLIAQQQGDRARGYLERIESDFPESVFKTDAASLLDTLK